MAKRRNIIPMMKRYQDAIMQCRKYKEPMERVRHSMLAHYANKWYDGGNMRRSQPVNLIDRGVQILAPFLVASNPRIMISARKGVSNPAVRPFAKTLELALAHLFEEIKLAAYTLRHVAIDSMFCMGITKTGIMHSHEVELGGYLHDVGQPYCDRVDFSDYIFDIAARNRQEMTFEGNAYRLPIQYIKDSGLFKNYDSLKTDGRLYGSDTSPDSISKDINGGRGWRELHPTAELIDLWLPDENIIITVPNQGEGSKIMRIVEWDGPEGGPYDTLAYKQFPGSIVPIPPVYMWLDLNKSINTIINSMRNITEREKTIGVYDKGDIDDAQVIKDAQHGDLVGVNGGKDTVTEVTFGGFNPQSLPFLQFLFQQYSQSGPNLEITGGRAPMSPTLGQDQMLQSNALREVDDMVAQMYEFTASITRKLAWFLWSDPLIIVPLVKEVAGISYQVEYNEAVREGDFFDYTFDIEPYSLGRMNPEMRYQRILQLVSQVIIPLLPIAAQQGSMLNVDELVRELAPYLNISNVDAWWQSVMPKLADAGPYQPLQGELVAKSKQDQRGALGQAESSKLANLNQQQTRAGGQSSKPV